MNKYPVAVFLFKRPELTKKLLDEIASFDPSKIYIFQDAPRNKNEAKLTALVTKLIFKFVDSNSNINFDISIAKENLGIKRNIVQGITKVFTKERELIIFEDDCLPHKDFYYFAKTLLVKYANNPRIMSIAGSGVGTFNKNSYNFSKYQQCWGWATWKRAWDLYDDKMLTFGSPEWNKLSLEIWPNIFMRFYFTTMLLLTKKGQVKSWAFKWSYAHFANHGLAIIPSGNLISNLGFDSSATNTVTYSPLSNLPTIPLKAPLTHPEKICDNILLSKKIEKYYYYNPIAILGMLRQLFYYLVKKYAHRT